MIVTRPRLVELMKERGIIMRSPDWDNNSDPEWVVGYYLGHAVIVCGENCDKCKRRFFCYTNRGSIA